MARLENKPTHELWGIPKDSWEQAFVSTRAINYYKIGRALMILNNRRFFEKHSSAEIISDSLYKQRTDTIAFYEKRLSELPKDSHDKRRTSR